MIEVSGVILTAISVFFAILIGILGYVAGQKHNAREEGKKEGVLETELKNLSDNIDHIGVSIKVLREDISSNNKAIDKRINVLSDTVVSHGKDIARIMEHLKIS
jgi:hypothetical protein